MEHRRYIMPVDLKEYSARYAAKKLIPFIVMLLGLIAVIFLWGDVIVPTDVVGFKIFVYFLLLIIPFAIFKIPKSIVDKTYFGEVMKVWIETTFVKEKGKAGYDLHRVYMIIKRDDGKEKLVEAYSCRVSKHQKLETFSVGDRVFHLYGTAHFVKLPNESDTNVQCAACNTTNAIDQRKCRDCGHTLVK